MPLNEVEANHLTQAFQAVVEVFRLQLQASQSSQATVNQTVVQFPVVQQAAVHQTVVHVPAVQAAANKTVAALVRSVTRSVSGLQVEVAPVDEALQPRRSRGGKRQRRRNRARTPGNSQAHKRLRRVQKSLVSASLAHLTSGIGTRQ